MKRILTFDQVMWAYDKWCQGYTQDEIAKALFVSRALINRELRQVKKMKYKEPLVYKEGDRNNELNKTKKMDKECQNCEYSRIIINERGIGECYCYRQKNSPIFDALGNAPRVDALGKCNYFKIKNSLKDTKPRYSSDEIKALQEKIESKFRSYYNSKSSCVGCQYGCRHPYCILKFTLDYLNKKGLLRK